MGDFMIENNTHLVIIEGIPGSGKSTLAGSVADKLDKGHFPVQLFLEGEVNHPVDFESVAMFTAGEFDRLNHGFPGFESASKPYTTFWNDSVLLEYGRMMAEIEIRKDVLSEIYAHDIYESASLEEYRGLLLQRWKDFTQEALHRKDVVVFECCFMQNPITMMIGKLDADSGIVDRFIRETAEIIRPLNPLLVYLDPGEPRVTLERVAELRPESWRNFVTGYFTSQGWGKRKGLQGFDGVVRFYERMKEMQLSIADSLPFTFLRIDNSERRDNWEESACKKLGL